MAIKKNTNDLLSQAATTLADNSTQDITPQDVREMAENNAFSSYNKITDNNLVGLKNYSTAATYEAAQGVVYNGSIYISNTIPTPGAFNPSEWDLLSGGEINTSSNSGTGEGLALAKSGSDLPFKSLTAGTGITLTSAANELQISSDGEINTSSNSGTGEGLALAKSGSNLPFKSITAGTGITLTSAATELQISSAGGTDTNIGNANITFDANRYADLGSFSWTLGGTAPIGASKICLLKDVLIKGSDNAEATSGLKVTDINNDLLFDIRNNGQIGYGGAYLNTVGHKFRNPNNEAIIAAFDNDGSGGVESFKINTNGSFESEQSGQRIFWSYRQSGQSYIKLFDAGVESIKLNKLSSFINTQVLHIGNTSGNSGTIFQLHQISGNASQQRFFGNSRTTTNGRLGSDTGFNADQKGFECYDTDVNKKYFWNGTAWEKIKGNIESVSQATATTLTPNIDVSAMEILSSLAAALTIAAPTGTPHEGQELTFRFKDDGTARALTWNAIFEDYTGSLPTTTTAGKTVYIGCKYNLINTKWDVLAVQTQP
tara:strand:+ start:4808 stop:6442 length:1635 start_codon:yes stop_codon:yes gene_type:complete